MFDLGQHVGEMHLHQPSTPLGPLDGWTAGMPFEISPSMAHAMMAENNAMPENSKITLRNNKQAFVISEQDAGVPHILVIYSYDHRFYLTPLHQGK